MKKLNLFLGILSLIIAAGLVYANLTLPPESIWFDIGYGNWPWAPPIIFGIVGIILLATAGIGQPTMAEPETPAVVVDPEKAALNKSLENVAWGFFLVFWGASMFWSVAASNNPIREGVWSICVGLIFLGLNAARYFNGLRMSGFTSLLGIVSVLGGIVQLFGVVGMEGAFLLIILGVYLVFKPKFEEKKLFGKAEAK